MECRSGRGVSALCRAGGGPSSRFGAARAVMPAQGPAGSPGVGTGSAAWASRAARQRGSIRLPQRPSPGFSALTRARMASRWASVSCSQAARSLASRAWSCWAWACSLARSWALAAAICSGVAWAGLGVLGPGPGLGLGLGPGQVDDDLDDASAVVSILAIASDEAEGLGEFEGLLDASSADAEGLGEFPVLHFEPGGAAVGDVLEVLPESLNGLW